jgi:hypothetical protein
MTANPNSNCPLDTELEVDAYLWAVQSLDIQLRMPLANHLFLHQYYYIKHKNLGLRQELSPPYSVPPAVRGLLLMNFVIPSRSFQATCVHCPEPLDGPGCDYCRLCKKTSYATCTKCSPNTFQLLRVDGDNNVLPCYCPAHGEILPSQSTASSSAAVEMPQKTYYTPDNCPENQKGREIPGPPGTNMWWYIPPLPPAPPGGLGIKFCTAILSFFNYLLQVTGVNALTMRPTTANASTRSAIRQNT